MWAILILTLPTQPNAVRVRVWRGLKALGCAALRDGAYLLPSDRAVLFTPLADEVQLHGGTAMVLTLSPQDDAQRETLVALFDRSEAYGMRLSIPAGAAMRFDPGVPTEAPLVPIGGARVVIGFAGLVDGPLDDPGAKEAALQRAAAHGYLGAGK